MTDDKRKILEMVAEGKITKEDAVRLLDALGEDSGEEETAAVPEQDSGPEEVPPAADNGPRLTLFPDGTIEMFKDGITTVDKIIDDAVKAGEAVAEKLGEDIGLTIGQALDHIETGAEGELGRVGEIVERVVNEKINAAFGEPEVPAEAYDTAYPGASTGEELTSLTVRWVAGPVEIVQGEGDTIQITEYARRPLEPDERMRVTMEDGEVEIRWTAKQHWLSKVKTMLLSKRLVIELPRTCKHLETLSVESASGRVAVADIQPSVHEFEIKTASGAVAVENLYGDEVDLHTASGTLAVSGVHGNDLSFGTASGAIALQEIYGDEIDAATASGAITAQDIHGGDVDLHTVSGALRVEHITAGKTDLATASGSLSANACTCGHMDAASISGHVSIEMAELPEEIEINSTSGKVDLTLPDREEGFTLKYSSRSGSFHSNFPLTGVVGGKNGEGAYGGGKAEIEIKTTSGGIHIHRT